MLRIKLSALSYEIFRQIVEIYDKTVGGHGTPHVNPWNFEDYVLAQLRRYHAVDFRFGSKLTYHSKLWIRPDSFPGQEEIIIHFDFDPNADLRTKKEKRLAEELAADFKKAIDEFLEKEKLAITDDKKGGYFF